MPICFCKACYNRVEIPTEHLGRVVKCPICEKTFQAPVKASPTMPLGIWPKTEVLIGVMAVGVGTFLLTRTSDWPAIVGAGALFVLGAYLGLDGNRRRLYQSINEHSAILIDEIRQSKKR